LTNFRRTRAAPIGSVTVMAARQIGAQSLLAAFSDRPQQPADAADLVVLAEPPKPTQPAEGPLHHSPPGTVANRDTIDGVAPGGSQRGLRPPS